MAGNVNLANCSAFRTLAVGKEQVIAQGAFTWTAGGDISASASDDPALTVGNDTSTGVHPMTFPKCPEVRLAFQIISPSLTVSECIGTALDAAAGTATISLRKAGTATEMASGDILHVTVYGKVSS